MKCSCTKGDIQKHKGYVSDKQALKDWKSTASTSRVYCLLRLFIICGA